MIKFDKNFQTPEIPLDSKLQNPNLKSENNINPENLKKVSDEYEKYFLKEMIKSMRSTVQESEFLKANNAEKIFQEQLDDQYSVEWNQKGGFGLSDMIFKQLSEKYLASKVTESKINQLSKSDNLKFDSNKKMDSQINSKLENLFNAEKSKMISIAPEIAKFKVLKSNEQGLENSYQYETLDMPSPLVAPWPGQMQKLYEVGSKELNGSEDVSSKQVYKIKHDNGLESLILIQNKDGLTSQILASDQPLKAGQSLGTLNKNSSLVWTIKKTVSE